MPEQPAVGDGATSLPVEPPKKKTKKKQTEEKTEERVIHFRNYAPRTPELKDLCLSRITSADIEQEIDAEIESAIAAAEDQDAVLTIAPKKPNWDLKRDVERKMQVLQARTDRAVVQLIRMRIKEDKANATKADSRQANPDDERAQRDEAALTVAREVLKADHQRMNADFDD